VREELENELGSGCVIDRQQRRGVRPSRRSVRLYRWRSTARLASATPILRSFRVFLQRRKPERPSQRYKIARYQVDLVADAESLHGLAGMQWMAASLVTGATISCRYGRHIVPCSLHDLHFGPLLYYWHLQVDAVPIYVLLRLYPVLSGNCTSHSFMPQASMSSIRRADTFRMSYRCGHLSCAVILFRSVYSN
jgi:hypothetical protein